MRPFVRKRANYLPAPRWMGGMCGRVDQHSGRCDEQKRIIGSACTVGCAWNKKSNVTYKEKVTYDPHAHGPFAKPEALTSTAFLHEWANRADIKWG